MLPAVFVTAIGYCWLAQGTSISDENSSEMKQQRRGEEVVGQEQRYKQGALIYRPHPPPGTPPPKLVGMFLHLLS